MQFITNGPEVPELLLQAHEDGKVVFFCGAGISYPAGLPDFCGLVEKIYEQLGTICDGQNEGEQTEFCNKRYDITLNLLEKRIPQGQSAMRSVVPAILKPNLRRKGALDTHRSLLHLARNRKGVVRLVTTNFDCIFDHVIKKDKLKVNAYSAPLLPLAKDNHWDGLVYLHGRLPKPDSPQELKHLILTSGDFGLAYLTERWAAKFVSGLFSNYTVCFVGYSISDPVLRYMMDALAADRDMGETVPTAYAFGSYTGGDEEKDKARTEWTSKGVMPILYRDDNDHSALHQTLKRWSEIYRDGIGGKEQLIQKYAANIPVQSTQQDTFVGQMLWAISDRSGKPAKCFAEHNPVPPLEWLEVFSTWIFRQNDLERFGVTSPQTQYENLEFSLIRRPNYFPYAPWMALVAHEGDRGQLDGVMFQLGRWLIRHLDDPELPLWIVKQGGHLHPDFAQLIHNEIERFHKLEQANDQKSLDELNEIRKNAEHAIPSPLMRKVWAMLLSGRVYSWSLPYYRWLNDLAHEGLTTPLRLQLRDLLAPRIEIRLDPLWDFDGFGEYDSKREKKKKLRYTLDLFHNPLKSDPNC